MQGVGLSLTMTDMSVYNTLCSTYYHKANITKLTWCLAHITSLCSLINPCTNEQNCWQCGLTWRLTRVYSVAAQDTALSLLLKQMFCKYHTAVNIYRIQNFLLCITWQLNNVILKVLYISRTNFWINRQIWFSLWSKQNKNKVKIYNEENLSTTSSLSTK